MRLSLISAAATALLGAAPIACAKEPAKTAPAAQAAMAAPALQWALDDIEFMTRDGGRWIASNADYQSENEPFEAYGMVWTRGYANSMTARLFGITDGEETGDFWRLRQYWHPGKGKMMLEQFGFGGVLGIGPVGRVGETMMIEQTFYSPDGSVALTGHTGVNKEDGTHVTESFNIVDGEWISDRVYEWKRAPAPE